MAYGFTPAAGTDYTRGDEPTIAARLRRLARALHLHLVGVSGYRTPAHSVAVGGFANDPHTRGQASDTGGAENIPEATLEHYGLTRPFGGIRERNHLQLLTGGSTRPMRAGAQPDGPAQWLKQAGWPSNVIPIGVAIGGAESRWRIDATHTNDDGTTDDGWLQINSSHGYDRARLRSDPVYTARAGKQILKTQGLKAWTTYSSGAYKNFMGQSPTGATFGRTRPGGEDPNAPTVDTELAAYFGAPGLSGGFYAPKDPAKSFKDAGKAISSVGDFLKWISWIFHPLNILRAVEFWAGFSMILWGFVALAIQWLSKSSAGKQVTRVAARTPTPVGRGAKVVQRVT